MIDWLKPALEIVKFALKRLWLKPKDKAVKNWDKLYKETNEWLKRMRERG